ncbi:MAG: acyltransferase family protein [Clostridiales bacterium]|nr:acyltransferase family protein [Clostridiales bacterium]
MVSKIEKDPRTISGNKTEIETLITPEPKLEKLKERNYLIDNLKAIMIWVVVCTHYLHAANGFSTDSLGGATYLTMISCDMIIFIFASGYFSKNVDKSRKKSFRTFLYPYLLLSIVMYVVRYLIYGNANLDFMLPSLALWFMIVLFFYRFLLKDLVRLGKFLLPITFVVSIVAGFVPQLDSTLALGRAFGFLPFFILGYLCTADHIEKIRNIPKWIGWLGLILLVTYSFLMAYNKVLPMSTWYFKMPYAHVGFGPLEGALIRAGLLAIAVIWIIVFIIIVPDKETWYTKAGLNSMSVYALHLSLRHILVKIDTDFGGGIYAMIIPLVLAFITTWALSAEPVSRAFNFFMDSIYSMITYPFNRIKKKLDLASQK